MSTVGSVRARGRKRIEGMRAGFLLRMPEEMYNELKAIAEKSDRSINWQAIHYIRRCLEADREAGGET